MNANWSGLLTLVVFFAITAIGFIVWILGLFLFWIFLKFFGISTDPWTMVGALSTAVAAAAVFGAGFIAYRELSEVASSRYMEVADRLFDELNSPENIAARRWVFQKLPENPEEGIHNMTSEGQAAVKQVLNSLDKVAFMTQAGWIPDEIIMPWMHPMISKSWEKLKDYVDYERNRRGEPYYYEHAGKLAMRCYAWRMKYSIETKNIWIDNAL